MLLNTDDWHLGYHQILTDCRLHSNNTALILVFPNVDAVAAARIWSFLLTRDGVSHSIQPCSGTSDLTRIVRGNSAAAVILLNGGAGRNLTRLFGSSEEEERGTGGQQLLNADTTKVYVMDHRRPVHLANLHAGKNVVVFWHDAVEEEEIPSDGDNLSGVDDDSDESSNDEDDDDDDDDDDDQDNDTDEGENEFGVEEAKVQNEPADKEAEDNMPDKGEQPDKDTQQQQQQQQADDSPPTASTQLTARQAYQNRTDRIQRYYSTGSFYGTPAAYASYTVAQQLRFHNQSPDLLWMACVGVTDAYLHNRLDVTAYSALALQLQTACTHLFPDHDETTAVLGVYAEQLNGVSSSSSSSVNTAPQGSLTKLSLSGHGRILVERDYRFFLLRYSTLWDAMMYADTVSTQLQLHTPSGMHKLKELLAKMGFPLQECMQPYAFMKPKYRRLLRTQIAEFAADYGLENYEFTSFFRITGYHSLLSAADTAYSVSALLECMNLGDDQASTTSFNAALDALGTQSAPAKGFQVGNNNNNNNNNENLVNGGILGGTDGISAGLRHAMALQRSIVTTAASLLERNAITRLHHFRYAFLTTSASTGNSSGHDFAGTRRRQEESKSKKSDSAEVVANIWSKPLALCRLAHYIMDLQRENGKWTGTKARPLILLAEMKDSFLVVGYEFPEAAGDAVRNMFGKHFRLAAESMDGTFRFDSFDSNVVQVGDKDAQRFLEQLHYLLEMTAER